MKHFLLPVEKHIGQKIIGEPFSADHE